MEKSAAAHRIDQFCAFARPVGGKDRPNIRHLKVRRLKMSRGGLAHSNIFFRGHTFYPLRVDRRKRREIVLAHHHVSSCNHYRFFQRIWIMPHIPRQKRWADGSAVNAIAISFGARRLARVELGRGLDHLQHANRSRKNVVERPPPVLNWNGGSGRKTSHLGQRVHARIRAAGTLRQYVFSTQPSNG